MLQGTGQRLVDVEMGRINVPVGVADLVSDEAEDVGTAVPTTQGRKTPVCLDGGQSGVVSVDGLILGTDEVLGDSTTEENTEDAVAVVVDLRLGNTVGLGLIEGQQQQSVVPEVGVVHERLNEAAQPLGSECDVGIVSVVGHV